MNVLVVGGGGREHAIVDSIRKDGETRVFCAPGNAGISSQAEVVDLRANAVEDILKFVEEKNIDFTVVGPEQALASGIVDAFAGKKKRIFGPTNLAARLETSKIFAKEFMLRWKIPTASFKTFSKLNLAELDLYLKDAKYPVVLKADGLAAGKGVSIVDSYHDAKDEVEKFFVKRVFGVSGESIVVEEFMSGTEASVFAITDGKDYVVLPPAQDHKRVGDNDTGKNTGGMGSFAPTPFVDDATMQKIRKEIIEKTIEGTRAEGFHYTGCLYCGLMLTPDGPKVVEFNARFGDPETQAILQLIDSSVLDLMEASADGSISSYRLSLSRSAAVCVIAASEGYPDEYQTGKTIEFSERMPGNVKLLHSGTKFSNGKLVTSGGRVLGVTGIDRMGSIGRASNLAYDYLRNVKFEGMFYRRDIGRKAIELESRKEVQ